MFLPERREFTSAPCLAGGKKFDDISRLDVIQIASVPDMLQGFFSFLVGLRTYQRPGTVDSWHFKTYFYRGITGNKYTSIF